MCTQTHTHSVINTSYTTCNEWIHTCTCVNMCITLLHTHRLWFIYHIQVVNFKVIHHNDKCFTYFLAANKNVNCVIYVLCNSRKADYVSITTRKFLLGGISWPRNMASHWIHEHESNWFLWWHRRHHSLSTKIGRWWKLTLVNKSTLYSNVDSLPILLLYRQPMPIHGIVQYLGHTGPIINCCSRQTV